MDNTETLAAIRGSAGGQPNVRRIDNFIDGEYRASERWFDKRSPLNNALIARVAEAGRADVDAAVVNEFSAGY